MEQIKKKLANMDKTRKNYAVFDCDMTIINADVEVTTLKYQIEYKVHKISIEEIKKRLSKYKSLKEDIEKLTIDTFRDIVGKIYVEYNDDVSSILLTGYTPSEVYDITKKALLAYGHTNPVRPYMLKLFKLLKENNVVIYVCSASILFEVYVASDMADIPRENVIAINNELDSQGRLKGIEKGYITRNIGKPIAIKDLGYGYPPVLIAGDSDGDYAMLKELNPSYGMIINPSKDSKVYNMVDNKKYFLHKI